MTDLSLLSQITLAVILLGVAFFTVVILWFQIQVFRGKRMANPDGSADDWHEQEIFFGIAVADMLLATPLGAAAVGLTLFGSPWGLWLLPLYGFYLLWANTMTTVTCLRFHSPRITLRWLIVFPLGILVGAAALIWSLLHQGS